MFEDKNDSEILSFVVLTIIWLWMFGFMAILLF